MDHIKQGHKVKRVPVLALAPCKRQTCNQMFIKDTIRGDLTSTGTSRMEINSKQMNNSRLYFFPILYYLSRTHRVTDMNIKENSEPQTHRKYR